MLKKTAAVALMIAAAGFTATGVASAAPATSFGDGTWIVGTDIAPGTYVGSGNNDEFMGCWWDRLSGLSGEYDDVIASDYSHAPQIVVTIRSTDVAFNSEDCGTWVRKDVPAPYVPAPIVPAPAPLPFTGSAGF